MPEAHLRLPGLPAEVHRLAFHHAGKVHQPLLDVLGHAAQVPDLLQEGADLDGQAVETLGPGLPVAPVDQPAAGGADARLLLVEMALERERAARLSSLESPTCSDIVTRSATDILR